MRKSRFSDEQMVAILREADRPSVAEAAKKNKVSEQTIYLWIGGSAAWVRTPRGIDTDELVRAAASKGVLIEPGSVFFAHAPTTCRHFRMGYSAIAEPLNRDGVRELAGLVVTRPVVHRGRGKLDPSTRAAEATSRT